MYRVVGFMEYGAALNYLDSLVAAASPEELQAIDEIVAQRPEFAVYSGLSRRVQRSPSTLATSETLQGAGPRKGLAWVIALARLEMGGIVATFGNHPAPFAVVKPSKFEASAYKELLMDGAQTHYWSLASDPDVQKVAKSAPNRKMLSYIRRLNVARHLLHAAVHGQSRDLAPQQVAEVQQQDAQLRSLREQFAGTVSLYVAIFNRTSSSSTITGIDRDVVSGCRAQLAGEARELQLGTARVETFGDSQ